MTNAGCRHCSFWCISSICRVFFSDEKNRIQKGVVDQADSGSPNSDHDIFWCRIGFGKCFRASQFNQWAGCQRLSYKIHFSSHVTFQSRNSSLLLHRIRKDNTLKWGYFWFVVSSGGTYLSSFFTFPSCFQCQMTKEWSMLNSLATIRVVVKGSALMILPVGHGLVPMATP